MSACSELLRVWDSDEPADWLPGVLTDRIERLRETPCSQACCLARQERDDAWRMLTELYRVLVRAGAGSSSQPHTYSAATR